ncbi:hypothetical protein PT974_12031 [Cladobotryum mycophilum]|uniref:Uncharacterized protein n=1 Tax=Cladobotryum mycophilum TaxID=491253 RepID=A0ABR0S6W7_9HYPO
MGFTLFSYSMDIPFWPAEYIIHVLLLVTYYDHITNYLAARRIFNDPVLTPRPIHFKAGMARGFADFIAAYHTVLCFMLLALFYAKWVNPYGGYVLLLRVLIFLISCCFLFTLFVTSELGATDDFDGPDKIGGSEREKEE